MFAASKTGGVVSSGDPYWTSVSLLTNFENNLTFQDGSTNNFAITRNGVVNPSLNTPFTGGVGGSEYFSGTGYLPIPNNVALQLGNGNFTIEVWFYSGALTSVRNFFNTASGGGNTNLSYAIVTFGTACTYYLSSTGNSWDIAAGVSIGTVATNTWYHVALVRNGTTITPYLNGVAGTTTTSSATLFAFASTLGIGAYGSGVDYFFGNLSNIRIVKGTAVYTSAFTPPTAPLTAITNTSLLITGTGQGMFDNATFVDQGPNALTVTATGSPVYSGLSPFGNTYPGSVLFNGTSQYLSTPDSTAFTLGSGNFTVETWIYNGTTGARQIICGQVDSGGTITSLSFYIEKTAANKLLGGVGFSSTNYTATSTADLPLNQWVHVAFVRNGNTGTLYINGSADGTVNLTGVTVNDSANAFSIGRLGEFASLYFPGYISNLRIVKGTAVYTANFTPSTTPLTAITNTSLLVRGDTGAFYDLSNSGVAETGVGSIAVTTQIKKFGSESGGFNGSSQYLTIPNTAASDLYTGDFTIEAWVNCSVLTGDRCIFATGWPIALYISGGAPIAVVKPVNAADPSIVVIAGSALTLNTWAHVAFTRQGQTYRIFTNGTLNNTTTVASGAPIASTAPYFAIGVNPVYAAYFAGNIDDIRLTKGVARYTATFTPPTTTFPTGP